MACISEQNANTFINKAATIDQEKYYYFSLQKKLYLFLIKDYLLGQQIILKQDTVVTSRLKTLSNT